MATTTTLDRTGKGEGTAIVTAETVGTTPGAAVIDVHAPNAEVVHGHVSATGAGQVVLEGSADGTVWFEDTAASAISGTAAAFRFADRWAHYRLRCYGDAGNIDVTATLVALTQ